MAVEPIHTNIGPLQFGLRYSEDGIPDTYWFCFSEEDIERSREVLQEDRELTFDVRAEDPPDNIDLYVYLGKDLDRCTVDDDLSIALSRRSYNRWWPKRGWIGKNTPTDVERIKRFHWRAAYAHATLCKGPGDPVRFDDERPVQVKIALGYADDWYECIYNDILRDLSNDRPEARPTSSFDLFLEALKQARRRAEGSSSLELYYRLQRILEEYEHAITRILRDPSVEIAPELSFYRLQPEQAATFYHARGQQIHIHEAHEVSKRGNKMVPMSFVGHEPKRTVHTESNRFVARSLQKVLGLIQKVKGGLRDYIKSEQAANKRFLAQEKGNTTRSPIYRNRKKSIRKHAQKAERLFRMEKRFERYVQTFPVDKPQSEATGSSSTMYYDTRYAKLRELTNLLDFTLRFVDTDEATIPFEVDAFHALYERWCFIQIIEALCDIGFSFSDRKELATTPFYHHPVPHQCNATMWSERMPGVEVEVWYERRYPRFDSGGIRLYGLETRYRAGRTSYSGVRPDNWCPKVTPDIALEFRDRTSSSQVPDIITLDPTLGGMKPDKYEYLDAIRAFNEREPGGRESRQIVRASWGIHPGPNSEKVDSYLRLDQENDYSKGFLVLRPTEESVATLASSLEEILEQVGLLNC